MWSRALMSSKWLLYDALWHAGGNLTFLTLEIYLVDQRH